MLCQVLRFMNNDNSLQSTDRFFAFYLFLDGERLLLVQ